MLSAHEVRREENLDCMCLPAAPNSRCQVHSSPISCENSLGVNAWEQEWVRYAQDGSKQLVYMNGPFELMGAILGGVRGDGVDCILVSLQWPR